MKLSENLTKQLEASDINPNELSAEEKAILASTENVKDFPIVGKICFWLALAFFALAVIAVVYQDWSSVVWNLSIGLALAFFGNRHVRNTTIKKLDAVSSSPASLARQKERKFHEFDLENADDKEMANLMKATYLISRAGHFVKQQSYLEAQDDYIEALKHDKNNLIARVALCALYKDLGRPDSSRLKILTSVSPAIIKKNINHPDQLIMYYQILAETQYDMSTKVEALSSLKKARKVIVSPEYEEHLKFKKEFEKYTGEEQSEELSLHQLDGMISELSEEIGDVNKGDRSLGGKLVDWDSIK